MYLANFYAVFREWFRCFANNAPATGFVWGPALPRPMPVRTFFWLFVDSRNGADPFWKLSSKTRHKPGIILRNRSSYPVLIQLPHLIAQGRHDNFSNNSTIAQVISAKYILRILLDVGFNFLDRWLELIECIQVDDAQIFVRFRIFRA